MAAEAQRLAAAAKAAETTSKTKKGQAMFDKYIRRSELESPHALARMRGLLCEI